MCGIAGFFDSEISSQEGLAQAQHMGFAQKHRGPDAFAEWVSSDGNLFFSHRRLSIIDLTSAGAQPMNSSSGRFTIVFNGEIYNHLEIRKRLTVPQWRGHSDTETLVEAFDAWGVKKTLESIDGMFAIALWDNQQKTLSLMRDRAGEKPLYYGWNQGNFYFCSELGSLRANSKFKPEIDLSSVQKFLRFGYIPAPASIFKDIKKLLPGSFAQFSIGQLKDQADVRVEKYWSYRELAKSPVKFEGTYAEAKAELKAKILTAISEQLVADVPVGTFLSGGVDSSLVTSYAASVSNQPINTFTIGFEESKYDESQFANQVAKHFKTNHHVRVVTETDALNLVPMIGKLTDEPFADTSLVPTLLLSKFAREHVTVCLSGDAGDELFGGYKRYAISEKLFNVRAKTPTIFRNIAASGLSIVGKSNSSYADRAERLSGIFKAKTNSGAYGELISYLGSNSSLDVFPENEVSEDWNWNDLDEISSMMEFDFIRYLPDDILKKVDMASMSVSLETRVPLLDKEVVEFSLTLPMEWKYAQGSGKKILKDLLADELPSELVNRPKAGFGAPTEKWLRGSLKEWGHELLFSESPISLDKKVLKKMWDEHQQGKRNWAVQLWPILMLNSWVSN